MFDLISLRNGPKPQVSAPNAIPFIHHDLFCKSQNYSFIIRGLFSQNELNPKYGRLVIKFGSRWPERISLSIFSPQEIIKNSSVI